ncbi:MAG: EVE domain-containing protein [Anaerovoracaceae bacterium]
MTHIFVVNETTFNTHLQYLFAGTGFSEYEPDLASRNSAKYEMENTLTGMIADISKVRDGDKVLFYVTGCKKFFGVFEIVGLPFFETKSTNYLGTRLGDKYLPFRVKIKPHKVFAEGISEQTALDDISTLNKPYEMCWSMIYRKLTGMRGCSFLTDYEMIKIENLLNAINNSQFLQGNDFYYNATASNISISPTHYLYNGEMNCSLSINNRLCLVKGSHEGHVQAYVTQNFDKDPQLILRLLPTTFVKKWIGNEVICSVGEKRIDILTIVETTDEIEIRVIELKDEYPFASLITYQIPWYIKWVDQYVAPNLLSCNKPIKLIPTIFAYKHKRNTKNKQAFDAEIINFNNHTTNMCVNVTVGNLDCIYYDRTQNPIIIY